MQSHKLQMRQERQQKRSVFPSWQRSFRRRSSTKATRRGCDHRYNLTAAAREAFTTISARVRAAYPGADIRGVILEKQQNEGLELIVGGKTDPAFGKVITIGMGGTLVELIRDVAIRLLPVTDDQFRSMIHGLRGVSPKSPGSGMVHREDEAALEAIAGALIRMFLDHPEIQEFDIDPVILYAKGACVVDARIYTSDAPDGPLGRS